MYLEAVLPLKEKYMKVKRVPSLAGWLLFSILAVAIGLYPLRFLVVPQSEGLLGSKPPQLLQSTFYLIGFYTHIFLGGIALLSGFSQFFKKLRVKNLRLHRNLGRIYILAVLFSGLAAFGISFFATGGFISALGFGFLAVLWLFTTYRAYVAIKQKQIQEHQLWMIRSYALCFAAVTLRIYLPLFIGVFKMEFLPAYKVIAWLCWVPNILIAEFLIVRPMQRKLKG